MIKKTINKFLKKYPDDLHEVMDLWERENNIRNQGGRNAF